MGFIKILRRFGGDESGALALWAGIGLPMIMGIGALALDMNQMYTTKAELQHTADAAALAAARALPDESAATTAAQNYAELNMAAVKHGTVVASNDVIPGNWDSASRTFTPAGNPTNAVRVNARRSHENGNAVATSLASALGITSVDVSAWAIAAQSATAAGNSCVIALSEIDTDASRAFHLQGNGSVKGVGCDIQINSCNETDALYGQGNTYIELTGGAIKVCGEAKEQGPAWFIPPPAEGIDKNNLNNIVSDPFKDITASPDLKTKYDETTAPTDSDCTFTDYTSTDSAVELSPGTYCGGIRLTGGGSATFEAGTYIIKDGELYVGGSKTVEGVGVTFFLTGAASNINIGGTADIHLSAPPGGDFPGFIFFGDREYPASGQHIMRGTPMGGYNGKIYLSKTEVLMQGTAGVMSGYLSDCTVIVADTFDFLGTPNFEAMGTCNDYGGAYPTGVATIVH